MRNVYKAIIFIILATFATNCSKDQTTETIPAVKLASNTLTIENTTSQMIQEIDSSKIIFQGSNKQIESISFGSIIISGSTTQAPFGFLRKVSSIQINGDKKTMLTSEATLTDAFEELHVDYSKSYTSSDIRGRARSTSFNIDIPNVILYDADGNESSTIDQIAFGGNLELTPDFHFKIDISKRTLQYAKIETTFDFKLIQSITAGGEVGSFSKEKQIFSKPLSLFIIPGTPIVVVPNLRVNIGAEASINLQLAASCTTTSKIKSFLEFSDGQWKTGHDETMTNQFVYSGVTGTLTAKAYVEPGLDLKLWNYDWAKASIVSQSYLKFSGQLLPKQDCELKAGINAGAEANLKFFGLNFSAASYPEIFDFSKVLYTCSANPKLATLTTKTPTTITSNSAESGGSITSDGANEVTARGICWNTSPSPTITNSKTTNGSGAGEYSSSITSLLPNTKYYARAYATNSVGTAYGNEIDFTTPQQINLPQVTTSPVSNITFNSAQCGGQVLQDGGGAIIADGVCWSTSPSPTINDNKTIDGSSVSAFVSQLTSLNANTTYYVRAYATNSLGTIYGSEVSFTTTTANQYTYTYLNGLSFGTDINGNVWNIWSANGSNIWNWQTNYVSGYLHYSFKILNYSGFYCNGSCRYHNIWDKDPTSGFELSNVQHYSSLFPESNQNDHIYQVDVQWNSTGYNVSVYDLTTSTQYSSQDYTYAVNQSTYDSWTWGYSTWDPNGGAYYQKTAIQHASEWTTDIYMSGPTGLSGGGGDLRTDALKVMQ